MGKPGTTPVACLKPDMMGVFMSYRLVVSLGDRALRFSLAPGVHAIGSNADATIRIPHPTVSRRHAAILVTADQVSIRDLGSSNGTRVAGAWIGTEVVIAPGEKIRFGSVEAQLGTGRQHQKRAR